MSKADLAVELRPGLIGQRVKRTEDLRLLAGAAQFVDDIRRPDLLHVAVMRSDQPHARILDILCDAAASVVAIAVRSWPLYEAGAHLLGDSRLEIRCDGQG